MTPVLFRKDRDGEVTAVFPTIVADVDGSTVSCYAHIGQHSGCSRAWYWTTKRASPQEYADLLAELRSIGYDDLRIMKRWSNSMVPA